MLFDFFYKKKLTPELPVTTDIHCHIVPGVDDGSQDVATSVELVERMHEWGYNRIFASPHMAQEMFENTSDGLDAALHKLRDAVEMAEIDVAIDRHAEYRLDDYSLPMIFDGNVKTLPKRYILVENSFIQEPCNMAQLIFDLKVKDYTPILAHPERYVYYWGHNRHRYKELHELGLLFQINLLSLAGYYGRHEKAVAEWLIDNYLVDFIGSDIHGMRHIDAIDAYLRTKNSGKHFEKLQGRLLNDTI